MRTVVRSERMKLQLQIISRRRRVRRMPGASTTLTSPPPPLHFHEPLRRSEVVAAVNSTPPPSAMSATAPPGHAPVITKPHPTNGNKRPPPILIYPTVSPESIVVPIVSCIFGFPLLALTVICCLRRRAKLARERARRRNCELDRGELSVVRVSPAKRARAISLVRSPRPLPALELDTVLEEKSDPEQTQVEMMTPDREVGAILFAHEHCAGVEPERGS